MTVSTLTPAMLDRMIASRRKDGQHGDRNCPKCSQGYMAYQVMGSSSVYVCEKCANIEFGSPPWPKKSK